MRSEEHRRLIVSLRARIMMRGSHQIQQVPVGLKKKKKVTKSTKNTFKNIKNTPKNQKKHQKTSSRKKNRQGNRFGRGNRCQNGAREVCFMISARKSGVSDSFFDRNAAQREHTLNFFFFFFFSILGTYEIPEAVFVDIPLWQKRAEQLPRDACFAGRIQTIRARIRSGRVSLHISWIHSKKKKKNSKKLQKTQKKPSPSPTHRRGPPQSRTGSCRHTACTPPAAASGTT
jgi:hypothetical protein